MVLCKAAHSVRSKPILKDLLIRQEYALGVLYYLTCYDDDASMAFCQTGMTLLLEEIMPK